MTKGGVMIGNTVMTRSSDLRRKAVRVAISAKARPSAVEPRPTSRASRMVFQATPQEMPPPKQPSPQIELSVILATNRAGAAWPSLSVKALTRIFATGKKTKSAMRVATTPIDETTNASPRHQPSPAAPWQASSRQAPATISAPMPMPC